MFNIKKIKIEDKYILPLSILVSAVVISGAWVYISRLSLDEKRGDLSASALKKIEEKILPKKGFVLPVKWGDLGIRLTEAGVIDAEKFESLYNERSRLDPESKQLLSGAENDSLKITPDNSQVLLNLLWALGLGNKNDILEKGEMVDERYGGADKFASTGGWTLAKGNSMDHYSKHGFVVLTPEQQALVESVSKNIYRPCCGNSTHFPDCNHGMAMLGLLELMASQGISEKDMYKYALQVNSLWFPDTYLNIAKYLKIKKIDWNKVEPKELLGANFSSASGYRQVLSQIQPETKQGGGGCGI
ncbi:MAG: hypothetical protein HYX21_00890 [Candidatus Yanofskybacteria bacterium]|nr:hypothetical protein [Candidatus Yanofskybacteria bacterium]